MTRGRPPKAPSDRGKVHSIRMDASTWALLVEAHEASGLPWPDFMRLVVGGLHLLDELGALRLGEGGGDGQS